MNGKKEKEEGRVGALCTLSSAQLLPALHLGQAGFGDEVSVVQIGNRIVRYSPQPPSCLSALGVAQVCTKPGFVWMSEGEDMGSVMSELRIGVGVKCCEEAGL